MQHGTTSVYEHSLHVAETSLAAATFLHLQIDQQALVRGALLHDYFLRQSI
ncbi:MAG: HDIG domain-containing protein [Clostridiales bacterium]|nr:HDIG domain-containing protein [Clostridiales bacterium]